MQFKECKSRFWAAKKHFNAAIWNIAAANAVFTVCYKWKQFFENWSFYIKEKF